MGQQPAAGLTGLGRRGAGQKGNGDLFSLGLVADGCIPGQ